MTSRLPHLFLVLCLTAFSQPVALANTPTIGNIVTIYIHDCCNRGPVVAVVLDTPLNGQPACSLNNHVVATSPHSPLARHLMAAALSAKLTGRQVTVHSKGSCDSSGVFDEWIGIQVH